MIKIERKQFKVAPEGVDDAVVVDVNDLGLVQTHFGEKEQIKISWEISSKMEDGRPYVISKTYNKSLAEKSTLLKDLISWNGGMSEKELNTLDLDTYIEKPCRLLIVHKPGKEGRVFSNVDRVLKPGDVKLTPSGNYIRIKDRIIEKCIDSALLK